MVHDKKKIVFFGCPLDCDEREETVQEKLQLMRTQNGEDDPYWHVISLIRKEVPSDLWEEKGSIEVEEWLRPLPPQGAIEKIKVENFVEFLDSNGCYTYSRRVRDIVSQIYPNIPCMIGIDHSLSVGAFNYLSEQVGPANISMVVLDSHTDALSMSSLASIISYDIETNPSSPFDPNDPFLKNRPEAINASSFLYHMIEAGSLDPRHLYIIGISDYPPKRSFRIKDIRVQEYVNQFLRLKRLGATLITKKEIVSSPSKLRHIIKTIRTPYFYISVDMDIGARNALHGVRFLDRKGLNEREIYRIIVYLKDLISKGTELIGLDLMEFNPRKANLEYLKQTDPVYHIAANIVKRLLLGL